MPYVTEAHLIKRYGEDKLVGLTDQDNDGQIDEAVLVEAIADADKLINSYLAPRYTLPLSQAMIDGSPLPRIAGDIVVYLLQDELAIEESRERYDRAIAWLKRVQMNQASLGEADSGVATPPGTFRTAQGSSSNFDFASY